MDHARNIVPSRWHTRARREVMRPKMELCAKIALGATVLSVAAMLIECPVLWPLSFAGIASVSAVLAAIFRCTEAPRQVVVRDVVPSPQGVIH